MKDDFPKIRPLGERGILIDFKPQISDDLIKKIIFYKNKLQKYFIKEKVEVTNTFHSLLVFYHSGIENLYNEVLAIKTIMEQPNIRENINYQLYYLPVCYEQEFGWDLELISSEKNLDINQIIKLHTTPVYTVNFIGFLPGFLYLGGLDPKLQISRKNTPRFEVPKGSVGIGENQTGIYPKVSPGGWQIIGNSPVPLFDRFHNPPCLILPGDRIKFYSVTKEEYLKICERITTGNFILKKEAYER